MENMKVEESLAKCAWSESLWLLVTKGEKNVEVKTMFFWKKAAVNTEMADKISSVKPQGEKELRRSDALSEIILKHKQC